ncbi:MAG: hypothetical protein ACRD0X_00590, partial [Thermoanaerobaculia bacterium]
FAGCYTGAISDPAAGRTVTMVLEDPGDNDRVTLTGCMEVGIDAGMLATLAGSVQEEETEQAVLIVVPTNGRPSFSVRVTRDPTNAVAAMTVDVTNEEDSPFNAANDLPRCDPVQTCESLGISQMFQPGGGAP